MNISRLEETNKKNLRGKGGQKVNNNSARDSAQTHGFPRELTTLRVAQFVLKIAHLAISMKPRWTPRLRSPTPIMAPGFIKQ